MTHRFFFFAGGDHKEGEGNAFTANFIRYQSEILGSSFSVIEGIYSSSPLKNVIWALHRAQEPAAHPGRNRILRSSVDQILAGYRPLTEELTLVSSSYGSVVAAQVACCLAEKLAGEETAARPFNLALGASMVSKQSGLYRKLAHYQETGIIGTLIYDELQDEGDNSGGIGGTNRIEGYLNGLGICFPFLTSKFKGPSFLNNDPVSGHMHRVRAQSIQKARDFVRVIFQEYRLAGEEAAERAEAVAGT
jgi:hypothetical protein